eukprot:655531-Pelagomonas_calceolata.AAC.5
MLWGACALQEARTCPTREQALDLAPSHATLVCAPQIWVPRVCLCMRLLYALYKLGCQALTFACDSSIHSTNLGAKRSRSLLGSIGSP